MAVRAVVGYDGSPAAATAIDVGAALLPQAHALISYLWTPPFADTGLRHRLWTGDLDRFIEAIEREGGHAAQSLADTGARLARAAGWEDAEPLVRRSYGGEGLYFAQLAEEVDADLVIVGARGLGGVRAVLGSVSDMVVHYTPRAVLVIPHPLLTTEQAALAEGPVVVGWDGSAGAEAAVTAASQLFPTRDLKIVSVDDEPPPPPETSQPQTGNRTVTQLHVDSISVPPSRAVANALIACARDHDAAVLAVGSRGRSAVREILLGSVAMATLHHAHRPVLVVPQPHEKPA